MKCKKCGSEVFAENIMTDPPQISLRCPKCGLISENDISYDEHIYDNLRLPTAEDVYWNEFRDRAAIAVMQGMVAFNGGSIVDIQRCVELADALIKELKK